MATLYLMRHGQTLFNQLNLIQGWCDSPLTADGIAQAKTAYDYFSSQNITFDKIYSSTSERSCDTCELASGRTDYTRVKGLKEFNFGRMEGQPEFLHPETNVEGDFADYYVQFGGESQTAFSDRVIGTIQEIMASNQNQKTILMTAHAGTLISFYQFVTKQFQSGFRPSNCCILKLSYQEGKFKLLEVIDPVDWSNKVKEAESND
ncbi:histidine phosphatase family protein [Streptococcus loxodontisalivarius]|uniref:Phosphoglycerate mutase n=1 Tax=Streptococcus loxodontisalivarius TaxID=1349415 RepID=A0ABS2PRY0_9STRE|nr:histidine phosphatase family protein [Streptococcus loxodontisalivarius]MBM7642796.1 putative phosphoglycerate mutase [Streptococcus loxodontisalivarius]